MLVRAATVDDLADVEAARIATWKVAYRGMIPDHHLDAMSLRADRVDWLRERFVSAPEVRTFVAVEDQLIGMATVGPSRDEDLLGRPELYALYVLADHWRGGVGSALLRACRPVELLWVLEANHRARTFYERHGFVQDGARKGLDFDASVPEIRYVLGSPGG